MNRQPSVTTVLSLLNKEGLSWAAARESAMFAVHHTDQWNTLEPPQAVDRIRKHHRGVWDHRAALGTCVHAVNEAWARGEDPDLVFVVKTVQTATKIWQDRTLKELVDEIAVMVDGLEDAWKHLQPETLSCEDVVRFPHPTLAYIGQTDWRAKINGRTLLIDLKSTGELDPTKAFYYSDWRLQCAAYRYCTEIVRYPPGSGHRPYARGIEPTAVEPLTPVDGCAILHLRANGRWEFFEIEAGEREHQHFLGLRELWGWLQTHGKKAA